MNEEQRTPDNQLADELARVSSGNDYIDRICNDAATRLRSLSNQVEAVSLMLGQRWQPIETAPKDGAPILVSNAERDGAWIAYYHPVYSSGYRPDNPWSSLMLNTRWHKNKWASYVPTRWMPIPATYPETAA